MASKLTRHLW